MTQLHTIEGFLLGVVATCSLLAGLFFLRYWRDTRDSLFLNFALAFIIEGINRTVMMFYEHPNEASPWVYLIRSFAFLLIVAAIIKKNRPSRA
ncbi:MAG TPA: DUF5985 family protein [Acidobacteriaceae bacterium]|jgi:uncharacterized membrane protein HdeD (DUF308 family)|nr:DUF5985 family protein [Acidobacteriaceae bacterium]